MKIKISAKNGRIGRPPKDYTGQRFGRLVVIRQVESETKYGRKRTRYECRCDCGNVVVVPSVYFLSGSKKSCGCLRRDRMRAAAIALKGYDSSEKKQSR